uniref:Uncharacterized protein n=1 Tax=Sphaerodactylus townsendi TaxID=933632 RepID=A0ACB8ETI6_9SAUR
MGEKLGTKTQLVRADLPSTAADYLGEATDRSWTRYPSRPSNPYGSPYHLPAPTDEPGRGWHQLLGRWELAWFTEREKSAEDLELRREVERLRMQQRGQPAPADLPGGDPDNQGKLGDLQPGPPPPGPLLPPGDLRCHRKLKAHFDSKSSTLPYFLVQVEAHMQQYGEDYLDELKQVQKAGALLEGEAPAWFRGLYEGCRPELLAFPHFMTALQQRFEDPF